MIFGGNGIPPSLLGPPEGRTTERRPGSSPNDERRTKQRTGVPAPLFSKTPRLLFSESIRLTGAFSCGRS